MAVRDALRIVASWNDPFFENHRPPFYLRRHSEVGPLSTPLLDGEALSNLCWNSTLFIPLPDLRFTLAPQEAELLRSFERVLFKIYRENRGAIDEVAGWRM